MERMKLKEAREAKAVREKRRLSQQDVADEIGCSRHILSMWERGESDPQQYYIDRLCKYYGVQDPTELDLVPRALIMSLEEIIKMLERYGRREVLAMLQTLPAFATVDLSTFLEPAEYLAQARLAIDTAWRDLNAGNFHEVQRTLSAHVSSLTRFAYIISPFQEQAAALAVEAKILQVLLANRDMQFGQRELCCAEAVQFGALSGDPNLLALALFWHGDTFTYCYHRPQRAIPLLSDALKSVSHVDGNPLTATLIYSDLSIAHAQNRDECSALHCIEASYSVMPGNPTLDNRLYRIGPAEVDQAVGKTYLELAEYLPDRYAQKAYDALEQSTNKQARSIDYLVQALIRKADAARLLNEKNECIDNLTEAYRKVTGTHRIKQIDDVLGRVPQSWRQETPVVNLQKEVSNALVVARA